MGKTKRHFRDHTLVIPIGTSKDDIQESNTWSQSLWCETHKIYHSVTLEIKSIRFNEDEQPISVFTPKEERPNMEDVLPYGIINLKGTTTPSKEEWEASRPINIDQGHATCQRCLQIRLKDNSLRASETYFQLCNVHFEIIVTKKVK